MNDEEIIHTFMFWILHGHQLVVQAVVFVLYILSLYPEYQMAIREEIKSANLDSVSKD